jgi:pyroglutamyl-peptidase
MPTSTRLLLTGFEPFGGMPRNPSGDAVLALAKDAVLHRAGLVTAILPVHARETPRRLLELLASQRPRAVVLTGVASGRPRVSVERIAVNCWRVSGAAGAGRHIVEDGPDGLFTTLPLDASVEALSQPGVPAVVSESAGTFACNLALYTALLRARLEPEAGPVLAGFVHLPATPESLPARRRAGTLTPTLALDVEIAALRGLCRMLLDPPRARSSSRPSRVSRPTRARSR